jgi:2-dehydro-3-deoxygalactonokinase
MGPGHFIGIDWGSTNARAMLFDRTGSLVAQREYPLGIKNIEPGSYRDVFHRMTGEWRGHHGTIPALLSGMIGSRHGWHEAPYLPCPASVTDLSRALLRVPDEDNVFIVPGLKMNSGRPDVLRGEELQLLGLNGVTGGFDCVCIPGTHSKWIVTQGPVVREFHTAMTGEVFAAVATHTLFAQLIAPPVALEPLRAAAFDAGLDRSAAPHGLLHSLFGLRAGFLLGEIAAVDLSDALSGLLIGTEIRHMRAPAITGHRVAVLGAPQLGARYVHALRSFAFEPIAFDVSETTARGFVTLFRSLNETSDGSPQSPAA